MLCPFFSVRLPSKGLVFLYPKTSEISRLTLLCLQFQSSLRQWLPNWGLNRETAKGCGGPQREIERSLTSCFLSLCYTCICFLWKHNFNGLYLSSWRDPLLINYVAVGRHGKIFEKFWEPLLWTKINITWFLAQKRPCSQVNYQIHYHESVNNKILLTLLKPNKNLPNTSSHFFKSQEWN